MSVFRSRCISFTYGSPSRVVSRQLIRRRRSPGMNGRVSANSIPSPVARESSLPAKTCVSIGDTTERTVSGRG